MKRRCMKIAGVLLIAAIPLAVVAISPGEDRQQPSFACDYDGFLELAKRMQGHRDQHLLDLERFVAMAQEPGTIVIDARSEKHFEAAHIAGSVNLPYTAFSAQALQEKVPDHSTRILIYCRNNLIDSSKPNNGAGFDIPFRKERIVGLNIPTVITLYAYGYENVWELNSVIDIADTEVRLVGTQVPEVR
jgi:hypothetical protein